MDNKIDDLPTSSDSKCLGLLYQRFKNMTPKQLCNMLDGKFTLVLYDQNKDFFMAARDPIGLCPLYYGQNSDGSIMFASELKALEGLCENY